MRLRSGPVSDRCRPPLRRLHCSYRAAAARPGQRGRNRPVPLYELVLRFPDRDEIRITDRNGYRVGDELTIAGRGFIVTGVERVTSAQPRKLPVPVERRFVVLPKAVAGE